MIEFVAIGVFVLASPFIVYLTVKLGTLGFFRGREAFKDFQRKKRINHHWNGKQRKTDNSLPKKAE